MSTARERFYTKGKHIQKEFTFQKEGIDTEKIHSQKNKKPEKSKEGDLARLSTRQLINIKCMIQTQQRVSSDKSLSSA